MVIKKRTKIFVIMASTMLLLAGCKDEAPSVKETAVAVNKDGLITLTIVEPFDKNYYDQDELLNMAYGEAQEFNSMNGSGSMEVESISEEGGNVVVVINFKSYRDYSNYAGKEFFVGTVREAYDNGYDLSGSSYVASDSQKTIDRETLLGMSDSHIVITEEELPVILSHKITYYSEGLTLDSNKKVARREESTTGKAYLVF